MSRPFLAFSALTLLAAAPALADDHPPFMPSRDVSVTYALSNTRPDAPKEAHMYYSARAGKMRLEAAGQPGYVIIDRANGRMILVMSSQHLYTEMPIKTDLASGFLLNDQMKFRRVGKDTIAGVPCTEWEVQATQASGVVCVTDDGVLLAGHGSDKEGTSAALKATAVSFKSEPPQFFDPPPGYQKVTLPPPGTVPGGNAAPAAPSGQ
jgi:hypothetical protein